MYNNKREENMNTTQQETRPIEKTKTIEDFIKENNISIVSEYSDSNPSMTDRESWKMNHYKVTLKRKYKLQGNHLDSRYGYKRISIFFSQGSYFTDKPKVEDVLDALKTDYLASLNSFNDFCDEFGYSNDSIRSKKTYDSCVKNGKKLQKFLNDDHDSNFFSMGTNKLPQLLECESL
jgi:hypothetical protein